MTFLLIIYFLRNLKCFDPMIFSHGVFMHFTTFFNEFKHVSGMVRVNGVQGMLVTISISRLFVS